MEDFLGKYYPGIKRNMHKQRIKRLQEILDEQKELYKKTYHEEID